MVGDNFQEISARQVPFPASVSDAARSTLSSWAAVPSRASPALDDVEGWRGRARMSDTVVTTMVSPRAEMVAGDVASQPILLGDVPCYKCEAPKTRAGRILLDIHGGGFTSGGGKLCELYGRIAAASFEALVYAVDYRMPPDHPYPAALDDCLAVYTAVLGLHPATEIVVRGISAGGNLAAALVLRARDEGLPTPAGLLLVTPELDLTESGDSFQTNAEFDVVLKGSLMQANLLYASGNDLSHPYLSPLFGDFAPGYPPTIVTAGTRDLFLSNAARMHNALRRSGNSSELIIEEAMPHGGFFGAPEDDLLSKDLLQFADRSWNGCAKPATYR